MWLCSGEPDPAEMASRYGAETSVLDWRQRLVCAQCGSRQTDMVLIGTKRRSRPNPFGG